MCLTGVFDVHIGKSCVSASSGSKGMAKCAVLAAVTAAVLTFLAWNLMKEPDLPTLDLHPWWGPGEPQEDDTTINRFKINVSEEEIQDLQSRLRQPLRLAGPLIDVGFTYGFNTETLKKIIDYWINEYDWSKRQARLNSVPQFTTQIEGLNIHFLRARRNARMDAEIFPLLLIHGWPGTVVEFYDLLPLLANPQKGSDVAFEIICPSIPGYGFSEPSAKPGLSPLEISQIFLKLMKRLGFEKFYVQGGDWGSLIASNIATLYPDNVLGVHVNMAFVNTPIASLKLISGSILPSGLLFSAQEEKKIYPIKEFIKKGLSETGYLHIQATKPDTVGAALSSSPVGLAAYILEKFSTWTHYNNRLKTDGGLLKDFPISLDALLDNVCIYWFSNSITSSMRLYSEYFSDFSKHMDSNPVRVPAGIACFPQEIVCDPQSLAAYKFNDIVSYTDMQKGGHFPALECPELLARDIHEFVTKVQTRKKKASSKEL